MKELENIKTLNSETQKVIQDAINGKNLTKHKTVESMFEFLSDRNSKK